MKKRGKRKGIVLILAAVCLIIGTVCVLRGLWENRALQTEHIVLTSSDLPREFDFFKIAHISDLHGAQFGEDNCELLDLVRGETVDIIVITGDIIDNGGDISTALDFAMEAVKIAPTYYVTGNHEARLQDSAAFKDALAERGVYVLEDETVAIERDGEKIYVGGLDDPAYPDKRDVDSRIAAVTGEREDFLLLLSHRPELFSKYVENGADLVFCGHAHGGQFRLPFIGGLVAPGQGLFPRYDSGLYLEGETAMIVSRGLGNSVFPFRLGNRPHVIFTELHNG